MKSRKPTSRQKSPSTCTERGRANAKRLWVLALISSCVFSGCRRTAFNELYVENMASEVRMLEDRVYEYDAAYQALEQELVDSERALQDIQSKYRSLKELHPSTTSDRPFKLDGSPKGIVEPVPSKENQSERSSKAGEEIELGPVVPRVPSKPPAKDAKDLDGFNYSMPAPPPLIESTLNTPEIVPAKPSDLPLPPPNDSPGILPPGILPGTSPAPNPTGEKTTLKKIRDYDLTEAVVMPPAMVRSAQATPAVQPINTTLPQSNTRPPFNPSQPSVDGSKPSLMTPPSLPKLDQGSILQGKIKLPIDNGVVLASATSTKPVTPSDERIVEIAFHPTLCRGHNFDETPGDDGLYLVLTPRNKNGEPINQTGNLTIVVEETSDGQSTRIAAWDVGSKELAEYLEPIGTSQGYHLSLPWQKTIPTATSVQVFVKFENEDGRTMVNRREVSLRRPGARQSAWTPR